MGDYVLSRWDVSELLWNISQRSGAIATIIILGVFRRGLAFLCGGASRQAGQKVRRASKVDKHGKIYVNFSYNLIIPFFILLYNPNSTTFFPMQRKTGDTFFEPFEPSRSCTALATAPRVCLSHCQAVAPAWPSNAIWGYHPVTIQLPSIYRWIFHDFPWFSIKNHLAVGGTPQRWKPPFWEIRSESMGQKQMPRVSGSLSPQDASQISVCQGVWGWWTSGACKARLQPGRLVTEHGYCSRPGVICQQQSKAGDWSRPCNDLLT